MPKPKYDPRSAATTLRLTGPALDGIPARDLSDADLARLAWVRCDPRPESVLDTPAGEVAALAASLVATGSYSTSEPVAPAPDSEDLDA